MHRRTFLATTGAGFGAVLGGCVTDSTSSGEPGDERRTPTEELTTPDSADTTDAPGTSPTDSPIEEDVLVDDVVVRKAVTYESSMGSGGVLAADGRQYVVASVRTSREFEESDFTFATDEDSWTAGLPDTAGAVNYAVAGFDGGAVGRPLGGETDRSYVAFDVPSPLSASNPRIQVAGSDGPGWPLFGEAKERLAAPAPRFELQALDVPTEVSQGHPLSVSLTARNVSDTDGRFLAAVYWPTELIEDDDESRIVERQVAAGDEFTADLEINTSYSTYEAGSVTLSVEGHVAAKRDVEVRDVSTLA